MTNAINLKPENEYVFVEHSKVKQTKTDSGIYLTEVKKYKDTLEGVVVAVPENNTRPLHVKVGDTVYFTETDVKSDTVFESKKYSVIKETDILGVLED